MADLIGQRDFGVTTDIYSAGSTSIGAVRLDVTLSEIFEGVVLHNSALKEGYEKGVFEKQDSTPLRY